MRNIFKHIIVPTIFLISVFLGIGELKCPLGLVLTTTLIGLGVVMTSILKQYKNIPLKKVHLIKQERKNPPLQRMETSNIKNKKISFNAVKPNVLKLEPALKPKLK